MPSGPRITTNNVFGTITDNPLTNVAVTMNSAGLTNLPAVASAHAVLVLDPLRTAGAPEIVVVTAHTGAATSATITRGAYGTSARQHASGIAWVHAATIDDVIRILTSATRPADPYRGQLIFETDTNSLVGRDTSDAWQTIVPFGAWVSYTPTLTQPGAVTKTVTYAKYNRIGRMITAMGTLAVTGTGTAANSVEIGLPVAAAAPATIPLGVGWVSDVSATLLYRGIARIGSTASTMFLYASNSTATTALGVDAFTAALAVGDLVTFNVSYEAAS